jgi:predicted porin
MRSNEAELMSALPRLLVCLFVSGRAMAADFGDAFHLHGYGSQDYLQASRNTYLGADDRGSWDVNFIGLVGSVTLSDESTAWAQLEASTQEQTRFTWFFVDYSFSDGLRAHIGRVKFPLGLYNEIIDAKFLQVSSLEPALYQQAADFVHDSYTGVGLDYRLSLGHGSEILWQAYGGNVYDTNPPPGSRDRRAFGGRITYQTPFDGLRLMLSGYRSQVELLATSELVREDRLIGSVDYLRGSWDVKSEYGSHKFLGVSSNGYYVQLGYSISPAWMPFVRYDRVNLDTRLEGNDSFTQKIVVVGLNFKLKSNISLRAENQFNRGYALPVASGEVPTNMGSRSWNLLVTGVHLIF